MCDTFSDETIKNYEFQRSWQRVPNAWDTVRDFERCVAEYAGAPYAVAVDSCTNALLLCLMLHRMRSGKTRVQIPARTYVGVAQAIILSGNVCVFDKYIFQGWYHLWNTHVVDSARRFTKGMYMDGTQYCLSFHYAKHLPIGRGGMILLDDKETAGILRRMRYDGRTEGVKPTNDVFNIPGGHYMMEPEQAARGLALMHSISDHNDDLPNDDYADLSQFPMFTEGL